MFVLIVIIVGGGGGGAYATLASLPADAPADAAGTGYFAAAWISSAGDATGIPAGDTAGPRADALTVRAAFAQTTAGQCPPTHTVVDGACTVDPVRKYKFSSILLETYNEHVASTGSGAQSSGRSVDSSSQQLVPVVVAFEADDCSLPETLGIVRKGPCLTHYERAQMWVLVPVARLYAVAALGHVTGVYPDAMVVTAGFTESQPTGDGDGPAAPDNGVAAPDNGVAAVAGPPGVVQSGGVPYHVVLAGAAAIAAAAAAAAAYVVLRARKERRIEA